MSYTTKAKVENYLNIDIAPSMDAQITEWIAAVKRYIDRYTGTTFEGVTETRYFNGNGSNELVIDDFVSISSIDILKYDSNDVEYALVEGNEQDYLIHPFNDATKYRVILNGNSHINKWPDSPRRRIKITGVWGVAQTVPEDVSLAATMLVAGIIEKGLKGGTVQSESLGDYSVTYKVMDDISNVMGVNDLLDRYRDYSL